MRNYWYFILLLSCLSCNSDSANDCFQKEGTIVQQVFEVSDFSKIRIEDEVTLYLSQGDEQSVRIETGENLLPDVSVRMEGETLVIRDENSCNFVRDYGITKAYVTTPNITEIRNSSSYDVIGQGELSFPELSLVSNTTGNVEGTYKGGDFYLNLNCESFSVSANGQSIFYISGTTQDATLVFSDEQPRFEGTNFSIQNLVVQQRSANVMIVNPLQEIKGVIRGTGDVLSSQEPPLVDVEELFTGRLIFLD
ncbi:head GIN domain-containing protein [Cochleicola gelatinilyticus]|uniref:Putative auto-transporter adhesin head GIN domain-containing protein n=1 Tax=Cochleicola gelatinilyticus TaxID=1763537 RepID=A0A167F5U7_9FLAO|nr:head GIN domain-containing protein [Cochleicola gelatinilyticus]OAB76225.1 hypothetical protein ULVI_13280 [Cochleicola gelatinilyticus]